jgi:hypothetical protein
LYGYAGVVASYVLARNTVMHPAPRPGRQQLLIGAIIGLIVAVSLGYSGLWSSYRIEARNGPASTIGKSGDMKSPGGVVETGNGRS